jgi:hypothetical protein
MENQAWYVIRDSVWNSPGTFPGYIALRISSPYEDQVDEGTIANNIFSLPSQAFAGIYWTSGGGTRIVNNKILTADINAIGIYMDHAASPDGSADIFITNNSLEGGGKYGVYLESAHGSAVNNFTINDNQFGGFAYAQIQTNSSLIGNVSIVGNQFLAPPPQPYVAIALAAVSGAHVADNLFDRASTTGDIVALYVGGGATDVTIGQNAYRSITVPLMGFSSTTSVKGLTDSTFAHLPAATNGSMLYCSDCIVATTCATGGTGAFAKRLNGAWVCN